MSLALFAMLNELKAEVASLTARVMALESKPNATHDARLDGVPPREPKPEPRPTLGLSKRA